MTDVFISYSRMDSPFVQRLHAELTRRERDAWVDWEDIAPTAEWMKEVQSAIDAAEAFVFVISPDSVASKVCAIEVEHAFANNKRMVPVVYRDVDSSAMPERLAAYNWIFLRETDDFGSGVDTLLTGIDTDLEWVRVHTRLLLRAREWESRSRDKSWLLRGSDLSDVEGWLSKSGELEPGPTALQTQFAVASRQSATSRQRLVLGAVAIGLVIAIALAVVAVFQRNEAVLQAEIAMSRQLAANAQQQLSINPDLALLLILESAAVRSTEMTEQILRDMLNASRIRAVMNGYRYGVNAQGLSPDGQLVLKQDAAGSVHVWHLDEGASVRALANCPSDLTTVAFSPAGDSVATAHADGRIRVWALTDGQKKGEVVADSEAVTNIAFDPDGKLLAALSADGTARVWSVTEGRALHTMKGEPNRTQSNIAFESTGRVLTVERDYRRRLYRMPEVHPISEEYGFFSPDGSRWFSESCRACDARVHDANTGRTASGFGGAFGSSAVFSSDGRLLLRAGVCGGPGACDTLARVYDATSGELLNTLTGHSDRVYAAAFSPDDRFIVTASGDATARVWETESGSPLATLIGHSAEVFSAVFSANGRHVMTASRDGTARVWDAGTGMSRFRIHTDQGALTRAVFTDDGKSVITVDRAGGTRGWNSRSGAAMLLASSAAASADANDRSGVERARTLVGRIKASGVRITDDFVVSRRGTYLITHSSHFEDGDGKVRVWDVMTGRQLTEIAPRDSMKSVGVIAISPDERSIATTEYCAMVIDCDRVVHVRETTTGREVRALRGHVNMVYNARFDPSGKMLVTSDGEGMLRLWHVDTGSLMAELRGHDDAARIEFSPDGTSFVTAGREGRVLVYHCESCGSLNALLDRARIRAVRGLSCQEQKTYIDETLTC